MKKVLKIIGGVVGLLLIVLVVGLIYVKVGLPNAGKIEQVQVPVDSASIKHGKYLAYHVAGCMECHGMRDQKYFAAPVIVGTEGKGGEAFTRDFGFPGIIYARNITPGGLPGWTDADIFHAMTTGITKEGDPLFPIMPYQNFGKCDKQDMLDILAFVRTLPKYDKLAPATEIDFPVNLIIRTTPTEAKFTKKPDSWDSVAYGRYLVTMSSCGDCHNSLDDKHQPIEGMSFAGNNAFILKGMGTVRSANITPDKETGIGDWSEQTFVDAFKFFDNPDHLKIPWQEKGYQTIMPWASYAGMTETDLKSIYQYLRTVTPINNKVVKFTAVNNSTSLKN